MFRRSKNYIHRNKDEVLRRCKKYRNNNIEKENERHILYYLNNKEIVADQQREYNYLDYYCPVCLYNVKLYRNKSTL